MKRICFFYFFFMAIVIHFCPIHAYKLVGLTAAHNEEHIIQANLRAMACYTDAIVFLDDASDDNTLLLAKAIAQECKIERIIEKKEWHRDEPGDRNALLKAGREIGGTHFLFLDSDEFISANCRDNNFLRNLIFSLNRGEKLVMKLIDLWRSPYQYRIDQSPYANRILDCAWADDGVCYYDAGFIHSSHAPRHRVAGERWLKDNDHVVLHFAFVNWQQVKIKYAWYKCIERIRLPGKSIGSINQDYGSATEERGMRLMQAKKEWYRGYDFFDPNIFDYTPTWRIKQIKSWFDQYGKQYFADLSIWDINWDSL